MSTVVDLTGDAPILVRQGKGSLEPFGFAHG
jgi:tRNA A37 threonylcarbamoyladenosine synthetase subunit TsaC/SUA5/YrdC